MHIEQHAVRYWIKAAHIAEFGAMFIEHAHPGELVKKHRAIFGLREFLDRHHQMAIIPLLRFIAIGDGIEHHEQPAFERPARENFQLAHCARFWIRKNFARRSPLKNTSAGREDRVRRIGHQFHYEFAANSMCTANAADVRKLPRVGGNLLSLP